MSQSAMEMARKVFKDMDIENVEDAAMVMEVDFWNSLGRMLGVNVNIKDVEGIVWEMCREHYKEGLKKDAEKIIAKFTIGGGPCAACEMGDLNTLGFSHLGFGGCIPERLVFTDDDVKIACKEMDIEFSKELLCMVNKKK